MTSVVLNDINETARALGMLIRDRREQRNLTPEELADRIAADGSVRIVPRTIEQVEKGDTDAQLDHMLLLLSSLDLDMRLPGANPAPKADLVQTRLSEIRRALQKSRRPAGSRKISFKDLSDVSGVEQGQIGRIEAGATIPRFRTLLMLTRALDLKVRFVEVDPRRLRAAARAGRLRRGRAMAQKSAGSAN